MHIDNKNNDILILGEEPTPRLDDTTLAAEAKYPINFINPKKKLVVSLDYKGSGSFLFVNATKIYQVKAKDSRVQTYPLCVGNISEDFAINNLKKKRLKGSVELFFVDYRPTITNKISDIYRFLMKETLQNNVWNN